jgi:hypothetical protein
MIHYLFWIYTLIPQRYPRAISQQLVGYSLQINEEPRLTPIIFSEPPICSLHVTHAMNYTTTTTILLLLLLLLLLLIIIIIIDKEQSYRWLKFGDIKGEKESVIMAAQDQEISTNYFKKKF